MKPTWKAHFKLLQASLALFLMLITAIIEKGDIWLPPLPATVLKTNVKDN